MVPNLVESVLLYLEEKLFREKAIYLWVITGVILGIIFFFFPSPLFEDLENADTGTQFIVSIGIGLIWPMFVFLGILVLVVLLFAYLNIFEASPEEFLMLADEIEIGAMLVELMIALIIALLISLFLPPLRDISDYLSDRFIIYQRLRLRYKSHKLSTLSKQQEKRKKYQDFGHFTFEKESPDHRFLRDSVQIEWKASNFQKKSASAVSNNHSASQMTFHVRNEPKICPVCRHVIKLSDKDASCPKCKEIFHYTHLAEWVKMNGECPLCQAKLYMK